MKIRNGFVSNSSSSSFVVYRKNSGFSNSEILKLNLEKCIEAYGEDEYSTKKAEKITAQGKYILFTASIEYGGEDGAEIIAKDMLKLTNLKEEDVEMTWED